MSVSLSEHAIKTVRGFDSKTDGEIGLSGVYGVVREDDPEPCVEIRPLHVCVLVRCGQLVSDLFGRYVNHVSEDDDAYEDVVSEEEETYMDVAERQTFDWLYDAMSQDMENADPSYRTRPKLGFYDDLGDFVRYACSLHEINRYVFGDGPCGDWDPNVTAALDTVREWRMRYRDEVERLPDVLIKTYETAAKSSAMRPYDVAMVAFAVFGFLLGYDTTEDFDLLYAFRDIRAMQEPTTDFRRVYNTVSRHARMFLDTNGDEEDREYFETLADSADAVELCKWTHDLAIGRPEFANRLAENPFSADVERPYGGVDGETRMAASDAIQLRVFYRWMSREMFTMLSNVSQQRISLLDDHVKRCMSCCLSTKSWLKMFNETYAHMLVHFTKVLVEFDCPRAMLETLQNVLHQKAFKSLLRLCIKKLFDRNSNLQYRDSSTDSNDTSDFSEENA